MLYKKIFLSLSGKEDESRAIQGCMSKNLLMAHLKDGTDERVADLIHWPVLLVPLNQGIVD